jgi:hypothetical protein
MDTHSCMSFCKGDNIMNYETIRTYRIRMNASGTMPLLDVAVMVDARDLPEDRSLWSASLFIDNVIHHLSALFGVDKVEAGRIRKELEAGKAVNLELQALPTQLIQAGFIRS